MKASTVIDSPLAMGMPKPPEPTNAPSVAVPILITMLVRIPAMMMRLAIGTSVRSRICPDVMPMPRAESTIETLTDSMPAMVLRTTGSKPYAIKATTAGIKPKPMIGAIIATIAKVGTVCPLLTMLFTKGKNSRKSSRVTMTPRNKPTEIM